MLLYFTKILVGIKKKVFFFERKVFVKESLYKEEEKEVCREKKWGNIPLVPVLLMKVNIVQNVKQCMMQDIKSCIYPVRVDVLHLLKFVQFVHQCI